MGAAGPQPPLGAHFARVNSSGFRAPDGAEEQAPRRGSASNLQTALSHAAKASGAQYCNRMLSQTLASDASSDRAPRDRAPRSAVRFNGTSQVRYQRHCLPVSRQARVDNARAAARAGRVRPP
jgi:hypothetical protein